MKAAYEIGKMPFRREIVMCAQQNPIYGRKLLYYEVPAFRKRSEIEPPAYSDRVRSVANFRDLKAMIRPIMTEVREAQEKVRLAKEQEGMETEVVC